MPRCIAIEETLNLRVVTTKQHELSLCDRRALRRDGSLEADTPTAERVELPLNQHERMTFLGSGAGTIQIKEQVTLNEDRCLGRIHVFGLASGIVLRGELRLAGGKRDDATLVIADGDHQASPKTGTQRMKGKGGVIADEE